MVGIVVQVGVVALGVGLGMAMVRVGRGPEVADRVLAVDVLSLEVVGLLMMLIAAIPMAMANKTRLQ